ncbi:MAG: hypothetical protein HKN28_16210 [Alphaproteobacteria bacterium]|nr:hypothetical protein [Alphaproteobacteria bacterium]
MDYPLLFYGAAAALFAYSCLSMAARAYQFVAFPRTFGRTTNISLRNLVELSDEKSAELPSFKIVVPAYQESLVIEATLRRLAALNYPRSHLEIYVVTYEDEPKSAGTATTSDIVRQVASQLNTETGRRFIKSLHVPLGFEGYFPGRLDADHRHIGKARGLNFALRAIHEENERDERAYFIAAMRAAGYLARVDSAIEALITNMSDPGAFDATTRRYFDPKSDEYVGPATLSSQLYRVRDLEQKAAQQGTDIAQSAQILRDYVQGEAARFFLQAPREDAPTAEWRIIPKREFLHRIMGEVEAESTTVLAERYSARNLELAQDRPTLFSSLQGVEDGEALYQCTRQLNSRWLAIYDADTDAPPDLCRHLAARILTDPSAMGFQGPVAAVGNFAEVHPLCRPASLWMAFCHATSYPRLLSKPSWAHPLAGTNLCFRLDGFERNGQVVRTPPYDEIQRRFILSFDPEQLTEDLEAGIRMFSDCHVNADWHPYLEIEQAPPTPRALIAQWTRWTQGTLQTLGYVLRSRLPRTQKAKLALLPFEVMASGVGPVITISLWAVILLGELTTHPQLLPLTLLLTFANLFYVLPFLVAYNRFRPLTLRANAVETLRAQAPLVLNELSNRAKDRPISAQEHELVRMIAERLAHGLKKGGFLSRYLSSRCIEDDDRRPAIAGEVAARLANLEECTPAALRRGELVALATAFQNSVAETPQARTPGTCQASLLADRLATLDLALAHGAGEGAQRRRERVSLCLWALPFLLFQLIPYYKGLVRWIVGSRQRHWEKTPRTHKGATWL